MEKFKVGVNLTRVTEATNKIDLEVEANNVEEAHNITKALLSDRNVIENFNTNFAAGATTVSNGIYSANLLGHEEVVNIIETFGNIDGVNDSDFSIDWSKVDDANII